MKAIGVADAADLAALARYAAVADRLLLDAKPPRSAGALPGGNGLAFDWRLLAGLDPGLRLHAVRRPRRPTMSAQAIGAHAAPAPSTCRPASRAGPASRTRRGSRPSSRAARAAGFDRTAKAEGATSVTLRRTQFLPHRPRRARPFRHLRRPLRRRNPDAAHPRAREGLCGGARPIPPSRPSWTTFSTHYVGRPSPLYFAERLTEHLGGAKIYFKRDELNHTGAHKINNVLGQILLARRMGKKRIIAETGAGQHGVATATALRPLRAGMHRLHGRGRCRAAEAQRLPHEDARRRGACRCSPARAPSRTP